MSDLPRRAHHRLQTPRQCPLELHHALRATFTQSTQHRLEKTASREKKDTALIHAANKSRSIASNDTTRGQTCEQIVIAVGDGRRQLDTGRFIRQSVRSARSHRAASRKSCRGVGGGGVDVDWYARIVLVSGNCRRQSWKSARIPCGRPDNAHCAYDCRAMFGETPGTEMTGGPMT